MKSHSPVRFKPRLILLGAVTLVILALGLFWFLRHRPPGVLAEVRSLAGTGLSLKTGALPDYFGVAVDKDNNVFFSDGTAGAIMLIAPDGGVRQIIGELDTPSAIAVAPDGSMVVADAGAHAILRVDLAHNGGGNSIGAPGVSGFADGAADVARFNGPVGVAADRTGRIFVADTYNDRIRVIDAAGNVTTLAGGGEPGFADGAGGAARFDTPCGLAVDTDGSLLVADTGNHRIRRVTLDGTVTTLAGNGEAFSHDGTAMSAGFDEPTAVAVRRDGAIFVADAAGSSIRMLTRDPQSKALGVTTVIGGERGGLGYGLRDDEITRARINRPTGLAFNSNDALIFVDNGNGLIRAALPAGLQVGWRAKPEMAVLRAEEIRQAVPPRWPFDPPEARRDVAGTFGEVRGELMEGHDAWFHNGLDIAGAYGETARAIFTERVTRPLAIESAGTTRERLRLPLLGYIHIRFGRDQNDQPIGAFPAGALTFQRDAQNQIVRARIRRGTPIRAGQALGTLNRLNHVHLIAGPAGTEINALAALRFPSLIDTKPPIIEAVAIYSSGSDPASNPAPDVKKQPRRLLGAQARIIVRAYDQVDGNPAYRKLGIYRLGYQVLRADGTPADGFVQPRYNLVFERLPVGQDSVRKVYWLGSQSGYEGKTIFDYVVTNVLRDGDAHEEFLDASRLAPGDYSVRVLAEDYFGNRATRDVAVKVN